MSRVIVDRCPHDMEILNGRSTCGTCKRLPDPPALDNEFLSMSLPRHRLRVKPSRCDGCGGDIEEGAETFASADGSFLGECCQELNHPQT